MLLTPRYAGPVVVSIDGEANDVLAPLIRQRTRLAEIAATFTDQQWAAQSRCEAWSVRDVIAHLATINPLYGLSASAGLAGEPTQLMPHFDPATSPPKMVEDMGPLVPAEVLDLFATTNMDLFRIVEALDESGWSTLAESPLGAVPIRLVMYHALWDSWIHERDILLPLGIRQEIVEDEVAASLCYVAALTQGFAFGNGAELKGTYGIKSETPELHYLMTVDRSVSIGREVPPMDVPILHGDAVLLTEALSTRLPLPPGTPDEWQGLLRGLEHVWDLGAKT